MFNRQYSFLIAGLGNPGIRYERTRHNAGFLCVDKIAETFARGDFRHRFDSLICDVDIEGVRCILCKPQTFMNNSGTAVSAISRFYKLEPSRIIVILDDVMLPLGKIRVRGAGSDGGHNGLKDIIELLGTEDVARIRIGVGQKPSPQYDLSDWVLGRFSPEDWAAFEPAVQKAADAAKCVVSDSINSAMNRFNG